MSDGINEQNWPTVHCMFLNCPSWAIGAYVAIDDEKDHRVEVIYPLCEDHIDFAMEATEASIAIVEEAGFLS